PAVCRALHAAFPARLLDLMARDDRHTGTSSDTCGQTPAPTRHTGGLDLVLGPDVWHYVPVA
ncbi:MAG: hypothetical protein ACYDDU_02565, partial [Dermatophilaceae bacterium]